MRKILLVLATVVLFSVPARAGRETFVCASAAGGNHFVEGVKRWVNTRSHLLEAEGYLAHMRNTLADPLWYYGAWFHKVDCLWVPPGALVEYSIAEWMRTTLIDLKTGGRLKLRIYFVRKGADTREGPAWVVLAEAMFGI